VFVVVVLAAVAAAGIYTKTSTKEYSSTAQILVTPIAQDNTSFIGLNLLRESGDPTRTVQTAAALLETRQIADAAAEELADGRTGEQILDAVSVQPEGESNVLDITATADSPEEASRTANAFANSALEVRNHILHEQIVEEIERLESQPKLGSEQERRIASLKTIENRGDPTMQLAQEASGTGSPTGASAPLVIGLALIAGLALGTGTAVVLEMAERRIRDEEEAVDLFPNPILARVPLPNRNQKRALGDGNWIMPANIREPFRMLMAQLRREGNHRTILLTSGSTGDGKTTSSINLAMTTALAGHPTILVDTDFRKAGVSEALRIQPTVMRNEMANPDALGAALQQVPGVEHLRVLAPAVRDPTDDQLIERFSERMPAMLEEAAKLAEFVIVDTPPLGEISDALRIAPAADEIIVVVYPGKTNRANYEIMRELLDRAGDRPRGLLVIGDRTGAVSTYYGYGMQRGRAAGRGGDKPVNDPGESSGSKPQNAEH
jgi:Mrp family chromosome partitioning ATPase/capsular polysaccharide biosynthesis protein